MLKRWLTGLLLLYSCHAAFAQGGNTGASLLHLTRHSDSLTVANGAEKLYIQFDKPYYASGDTIWFKAYLLNEPTFGLSARSGLLHVDIANDSNKGIKQYLFPVQEGLAWGKIALGDKDFKPGNYVLRGYTEWMRNFNQNGFFYKAIRVAGVNEGQWLVNTNFKTDGVNTRLQLQVMSMDKRLLTDSVFKLELVDVKKVLLAQNVQTDKSGLIDVKFKVSATASHPALILQNKRRTKKAIIPVTPDRQANMDLQFMPEGGSLVAGFPVRVGFKAIGEDGKGVNISGNVVDHADSVVASFKTNHNGMGSFYIEPQRGDRYAAKVTLAGGVVKSYALPVVNLSGTLLKVKDIPGNDSLDVTIAATPDLANTQYYLVAKARTVICYAAIADLGKEPFMHSRIAKSWLPSGIAHILLTDIQGRTLNERLVYIDHHDALHFDIQPAKAAYNPKDSVALHIRVTGNQDRPVIGNFSLAVTDDAQVKTDSLDNDNILSRMLLTSDLKGFVEGPWFYFKDDEASRQALDDLLLTQGWVNYDPPAGKLPYEAETEFRIRGRVNNVFNKPLKKTGVVLLSVRPLISKDTVTDKDGRFVFEHFPRIDTPIFGIKTNNRNFNVNIDIDETPSPAFVAPISPLVIPWYVNTDTTLMHFIKSNAQMQQLQYYPGGGRVLKEVKITAKKVIKGSQNLNGPGNADIVMDERDVEAAGKKTMLQVFEENIKGFREGWFATPSPHRLTRKDYLEVRGFENKIRNDSSGATPWYFIYSNPVILIMDGTDIEDIFPDFKFADFMAFMKSHTAEDIKGIEVNFNPRYNANYWRHGKWMNAPLALKSIVDFAFIEVTTRSGHSAAIKNTPGMYLYKPLAISWPKEFYKPKYTIKDTANLTDLRSTIDWEPNISTDKNGEATVWFYAAGTPSTYSIIMEGVDGNGLLGYKRQKLVVAKSKSAAGK